MSAIQNILEFTKDFKRQKCKECRKLFTPRNKGNNGYCSYECASEKQKTTYTIRGGRNHND